MKLTTFFTGTATAAMVAQLAGASPTLADAVTPKAKEFFLKTAVKKGSNAKFNGLYPVSWHTGAGTSVLILQNNKSSAVKSYLNETRLDADLGNDFPWGWHPTYTGYASWSEITLDAGIGTEGFSIKDGHLDYTQSSFIACNWQYSDEPQLFVFNELNPASLPCNCGAVQLIPEYV